MEKREINKLEFIGIIFTLISGVFLRSCFKIFPGAVWPIIFGAVNLSVWENIKCYTIPYIIWGCIEFCIVRIPLKKLVISKTAGIYSIIFIGILDVLTASFISGNITILSLPLLAVTFAFTSHIISLLILNHNINTNRYALPCIILLLLFFFMILSFTIFPPNLILFKDIKNQNSGIPIKNLKIYESCKLL